VARTPRTPKKKKEYLPVGWREKFLAAMAGTGNASVAAKAAGIGRRTAYDYKEKDEAFRDAWDAAAEESTDVLELEARRRALKGVDEPIFRGKSQVGTVKKYSDTLLIFLLKGNRPEKFRDNYDIEKLISDAVDKRLRNAQPGPGGRKGGRAGARRKP
jgi:hypothetical protein